MRTALSTVQQTLTRDSANILNRAISEASRRGHAQTTSLHVASALLTCPSSPLRQACVRSHASSAHHPLQCRALELCFNVALDRLPTAQLAAGQFPEPSISNALMAALKRAQAHQRRGCPEQQQQPLLAVKVELEQFIISILDDPSVSRVMSEAGFSSTAVKAALEHAVARFPPTEPARRAVRVGNPAPVLWDARAGGDSQPGLFRRAACANPGSAAPPDSPDARRVLQILAGAKKRRNPVLVGDSGAANEGVVRELAQRIQKGDVPDQLRGVRFIPFEKEISSLCAAAADGDAEGDRLELKFRDLNEAVESCRNGGAIINVGDLKWLVDGGAAGVSNPSPAAKRVVLELGQLLLRHGSTGRLWLIGTATCEMYVQCQACHPSMESSWELQPVPIAPSRPGPALLFPRFGGQENVCSSVESLVPVGASSAIVYALKRPVKDNDACERLSFCSQCMVKYKEELTFIEKEKEAAMPLYDLHKKSADQGQQKLPWWLQTAQSANGRKGSDILQAKDQETMWNHRVEELQKKWNQNCQSLHPHFHSVHATALGKESRVSSYLSIHGYLANAKEQRECTVSQLGVIGGPQFGKMYPLTLDPPWSPLLQAKCSASVLNETTATGVQALPLSLELPTSLAKCEPIQEDDFGAHSCDPGSSFSGCYTSLVMPVRTELALGRPDVLLTPGMHEQKFTVDAHKERLKDLTGSMPSSIGLPGKMPPEVLTPSVNAGPFGSMPSNMSVPWKSPPEILTSCSNGGPGRSVHPLLDQQNAKPSGPFRQVDADTFKRLCRGLEEKVGWQREAISAVTNTVMQSRSGNGKHRGVSFKRDTWLLFLGPDRGGKRKMAAALAEIIFKGEKDFVCIGLSSHYAGISLGWNLDQQELDENSVSYRGKTILDCIAEAVQKNPWSVVLLEDVDRADSVIQRSLIQAMERGRLPDSHGREFSLGNVIFVMTASARVKNHHHVSKKGMHFSEEKLLAAQGWQMQILVENARFGVILSRKNRVSVTNYEHEADAEGSGQVGFGLGFTAKRRVDWINGENTSDGSIEKSRKMLKTSTISLDLNLSAHEIEVADGSGTLDDHTEDCQGPFVDSSDAVLEQTFQLAGKTFKDIFTLADDKIVFRPFDFDDLADKIVKIISTKFISIVGSEGLFEIDVKVMEQILATVWLSFDGMKIFEEWVEQILGSALMEVSARYTISADTVVKLVIDKKCFSEERPPGVRLPSSILLNKACMENFWKFMGLAWLEAGSVWLVICSAESIIGFSRPHMQLERGLSSTPEMHVGLSAAQMLPSVCEK